ncbi:CoA-disulfide reductase [Alginatibacterium sediminis]|uniref:CoA-disulfide reductase n=1 Tax=Alginatibacterium sediminis TaxID=2164068 RepID=A0A420ECS6_9ALTE|nr:FAD-dependent oxidoreductase [Alginatibacterium sediminis]RKF18539.1 CoA-disulfide reductase [Alginatibacterium sediminis]
MTKIVIIGGVAGGASAAARARRLDESSEIIMFERGAYISFANCGLPYHIAGDISERDDLLLQTPDGFSTRFNVDVRVLQEVTAIDSEQKQVSIKNLSNGETYIESYDKLVLSPGAAPIMPPLPGLDLPHIYSLRNLPDMDRIIDDMQRHKPQHATVVGGGFIGLEMVEALTERGIKTTLLELGPQVMAPVDAEMAKPLHQELEGHGVDLRLNTALEAVERASSAKRKLKLNLSNNKTLTTDMLIMAIGVKPETSLAKAAGLELGNLGGIKVNQEMQSSDPDIYAVGDAVEDLHWVSQQSAFIPLAGPANRQGRLAANNIFGAKQAYKQTQGTAICKVFDLAVASTGLNEKQLSAQGISYEKVYVHSASHASYYPGAESVNLKLLFCPETGTILGAQAVGKDGIDKRIDVLAVAQRAGLKVEDLQDLELCYAPPFGSAKDPVNQIGFVASNVRNGSHKICHSHEIDNLSDSQMILDVRNPQELLNNGAIPGALNIPLDQLRDRLDELPKDMEILIYCFVGLRGYVAYRQLANQGFKAKNLSGGYKTWLNMR